MPKAPIGIVGAGAWGTALANVAASTGSDVVLWMRSSEQARILAAARRNEAFLPGVPLNQRIRPTDRLSDLDVDVNGSKATARFRQAYSADGLNINGRKTLELHKVGDRWLIVRESVG